MVDWRRSTRVPLGQAVEFSTRGDEVPIRMSGTARDISLGGTYIETELPCAPGEEIVVYVTLPRSRREMALPATVRWTAKDGMGVQFGLLGARETFEITQFVATACS